jgi:hypothetical protein
MKLACAASLELVFSSTAMASPSVGGVSMLPHDWKELLASIPVPSGDQPKSS